jgi:tetratricopeptide (TPR) repeat protein
LARLFVVALVVLACRIASADGVLVDGLGADDPEQVAAAVEAIESAPAGTPDLADALFAAGRACEDTLVDPARALALYERIMRELPDARVAIAASRRAEALRARVGSGGQHAKLAAELAQLVADANRLAPDELVRRGEALATATWPGAPDAMLWLAEWLRRAGRFDEAQDRYARVAARWAGTPHEVLAIRGGAGCALDAHDWERAEALAVQLPELDAADRVMREDLLAAAERGRRRDRWYVLSWIAVLAACGALVASLVEAAVHGGFRRPDLRPPVEVLFLAPAAAVLVGVALTTHQLIAPAVLTLSIGGLVLAWLSGTALDMLRARGRRVFERTLAHIAISLVAVAALGYIVITRDNLLDMVIETVRFGPDP